MPPLGLLLVAVLFYACEKAAMSPVSDDVDLITQIQSAENLTNVTPEQLPAPALSQLENAYSESFISQAKMAPGLGYEVQLRRQEGSRVGKPANAYFDMNGKALLQSNAQQQDANTERIKDCFRIEFPYSLSLPDGTILTIENQEDLQQIRVWYSENPNAEGRPAFVFPIQITFSGENESVAIQNEEELSNAQAVCHDQWEQNACLTFVFPISFLTPNGETQIQLETREDWTLIEEWYEANPDFEQRPELIFPLQVIFQGKEISLENEEELERLRQDCRTPSNSSPCFRLVFPITYELPDGTQVEVSDPDDWQEIRKWYADNPNATERPVLVYPIQIAFTNGSLATINSEEELKRASESCNNQPGSMPPPTIRPCFQLVYPFTVTLPNGSDVTPETEEDWLEVRQWYADNPEVEERPQFVFPLQIALANSDTTTVNSEEELRKASESCSNRPG